MEAVRHGDDDTVEAAVLALSRRSRWLAPLALLVGGLAMLFQGVRTLFINWRLTLIQVLPAMWIWVVMIDLKAHVLHGKGFHVFKNPFVAAATILVIALLTAASFYLNAVFAFAIARKGPPRSARRSPWPGPICGPSWRGGSGRGPDRVCRHRRGPVG